MKIVSEVRGRKNLVSALITAVIVLVLVLSGPGYSANVASVGAYENNCGYGYPSGEATDDGGNTKDVYYTDEIVYATGSGFDSTSDVDIYITEDKKWEDGKPINSTIYKRKDNVTPDANGDINAEEIWTDPIPGEYDIVFDADQDGFYNVGGDEGDVVDDPNDPGLTVLGRVPALTPIGLIALIGLLSVVAAISIRTGIKKRRG